METTEIEPGPWGEADMKMGRPALPRLRAASRSLLFRNGISGSAMCAFITLESGVPVIHAGVTTGEKEPRPPSSWLASLTAALAIERLRKAGYWVFEQRVPRHAWVIAGPEAP
jgi:hypothetical protein